MATSPEFLASLPSWIVYKFPALLTKRSGVSKEIVRLLNSSTDSGMGPKAVKEAILEQHTIRHAELQIRYYSVIESFLSFDFGHYREKPKRLVASLKARPDQIPCFSEFDDQKGFSGYVPSANYLKHVLNIDIERKRQYMDLEVQRRGGRVISVDHSFKVCFSCYSFNSSTDRAQVIKHICKVNGQPLFSGLFTAINEYGEVRCQLLVQSTSNRMLKEPLKNWKESAEKLNTTLPQIVFSDRCCDDHDFYCEAFPTLRQSLIAKPMLDVDMAKVHCYRGSDAVLMMERIKQELMDVQQKVVGLDCEWNRGNNSKVAVIQIALPNGISVSNIALL